MKIFSPRTFLNVLVTAVLMLAVSVEAFAQSHSVTLKVQDAATEEPVGFVTVSLSVPG